MVSDSLIEKLEAGKDAAVGAPFISATIDWCIAVIKEHQAQPCTDLLGGEPIEETIERIGVLAKEFPDMEQESEIRVPTDEYIFMILANETLSLSEQLDLLRPYLRTTEPVSVKEIRHQVTRNGGLCNEDAVKAVLGAAGVKYHD